MVLVRRSWWHSLFAILGLFCSLHSNVPWHASEPDLVLTTDSLLSTSENAAHSDKTLNRRQKQHSPRTRQASESSTYNDRAGLLSRWYLLEEPFRHVWQKMQPWQQHLPGRTASAVHMQRAIMHARLNQHSSDGAASRARQAMKVTCETLVVLGLPELQADCPETVISDVGSSVLGLGLVWYVHGAGISEEAPLAQRPSGYEGTHSRSVVVVHPELVNQLSNSELQALFGLQVGRLLLGGSMSKALWLWSGWAAARGAFSRSQLQKEWQALIEQTGLRFRQAKSRGSRLPRWRSSEVRGSAYPHIGASAREASVLAAVTWAFGQRRQALTRAADHIAVVAGGSVQAAAGALSKSQDFTWQPLDQRMQEMHRWAASPAGERMLHRARVHLCLSSAQLPGVTPWQVGLCFVAGFLVLVVANCVSSPGTATTGLMSLLLAAWSLAMALQHRRLAQVLGSEDEGGVFLWGESRTMWIAVNMFLGACCLYLASTFWSFSQCAQRKSRGGHTTVESLMHEVLPAAVEAAAGAALLARCGISARQIPLDQLDKELRNRWASSIRGLAAKLADLRRLAGTGNQHQQFEEGHRAQALCAKLDAEMRRALLAETLWMRRALEHDQEIALLRSLFWWLHDDREGDAWGSPRLAGMAEHVGRGESSALEKLQCPSLAMADVGSDILRAPTPAQDIDTMFHAASALEEQHRRLDRLHSSLLHGAKNVASKDLEHGKASPSEKLCVAIRRLCQAGTSRARVEHCVSQFLDECELDAVSAEQKAGTSASKGWCLGPLPILLSSAALCLAIAQTGMHKLKGDAVVFAFLNSTLLWCLWWFRLPQHWTRLEQRLAGMAARREKLLAAVRLEGKPSRERLAHLKALVLIQGVRTAQNLDYLTLCVQAEALRIAAAAPDASGLRQGGLRVPSLMMHGRFAQDAGANQRSPKEFTRHCLQLLFAVLPRHGRQGQRQVSSDIDIYEAMDWFAQLGNVPKERFKSLELAPETAKEAPSAELRSLQIALATSQRHLWMLFRLCDVRAMARPSTLQGTLAALLEGQLAPIVLQRHLKLQAAGLSSADRGSVRSILGSAASDDSGRILGDLDSTAGSNDQGELGDDSSQASGTVRRILAGSEDAGSSGSVEDVGGDAARVGRRLMDADAESCSDDASSAGGMSVEEGGDGMHRILAASDVSDGASSESASSAGGNSFALQSSMWSGMTRSAASSSSSLAEDMLTSRRPLLEGYADALRPLFMTRGDITHLLAKFPVQVLLGGTAIGRSYAAHRELLEELFGSLVVWVKSPERRGRIKLAFGTSFEYGEEAYMLGGVSTTLHLVAHGISRTGQEPFPIVYEEEDEDDEKSQVAASAARDDGGNPGQGVLEFEELVVPLNQISSRELFLAELMQSDQCQLLASLSQGSHSKYSQRALRRRRRTLRHVREATQLLVNVPSSG